MGRETREGEDRLAFQECPDRDGDVPIRVDQRTEGRGASP